jgi:hypothetical protein
MQKYYDSVDDEWLRVFQYATFPSRGYSRTGKFLFLDNSLPLRGSVAVLPKPSSLPYALSVFERNPPSSGYLNRRWGIWVTLPDSAPDRLHLHIPEFASGYWVRVPSDDPNFGRFSHRRVYGFTYSAVHDFSVESRLRRPSIEARSIASWRRSHIIDHLVREGNPRWVAVKIYNRRFRDPDHEALAGTWPDPRDPDSDWNGPHPYSLLENSHWFGSF